MLPLLKRLSLLPFAFLLLTSHDFAFHPDSLNDKMVKLDLRDYDLRAVSDSEANYKV
jgi:hypothetical protein